MPNTLSEEMAQLEVEKLRVEVNKIIAETAKINKENRWYEVVLIVAVVGAAVAFTKLFL